MFEDSLMESGGKIKTKSKYWMFATLAFNAAILATMILIPLLYPEALPHTALTAMISAPPPPPPPPPPAPAADHKTDQDGLGDRSGPACADEDS
jgi:protein TonB